MAKTKPKILITGAGGFLGTALARMLSAKNVDLVLAARKKIAVPKGAKVVYGDLSDPVYCARILKGVDTVYYTAGFKKNIAIHTSTPFEAFTGNTLPLLTFLRAAKESDMRKLIYTSSTIVEYTSIDDERIDGYVWGKYVGELAVRAFSKESAADVKIVRSAALYGAGDSFDPKTANFIPAFIKRALDAENEVVIWGDGTRTLQLIYIDDLARNMLAASTSKESFFNFGNPEKVSVNDIAHAVVRLSGKKLSIIHDISKPDKPTMLSEFKNLVKPRVDIEVGLAKTMRYYRTHV